jgi:hypothetical protein
MSKKSTLDPILLDIKSIQTFRNFLFKKSESKDSAIEDDFNDNLTVIDVVPQLENYRKSFPNIWRPTLEHLHQSPFDDYLSVKLYSIILL